MGYGCVCVCLYLLHVCVYGVCIHIYRYIHRYLGTCMWEYVYVLACV